MSGYAHTFWRLRTVEMVRNIQDKNAVCLGGLGMSWKSIHDCFNSNNTTIDSDLMIAQRVIESFCLSIFINEILGPELVYLGSNGFTSLPKEVVTEIFGDYLRDRIRSQVLGWEAYVL